MKAREGLVGVGVESGSTAERAERGGRELTAQDWMRAGAVVAGVLAASFCAFTGLATLHAGQGQFAWLGQGDRPASPDVAEIDTTPVTDVREVEVERGDTLSGVLVDEGTSRTTRKPSRPRSSRSLIPRAFAADRS